MAPELTPTPGKTHEEWLTEVVKLAATAQGMLKEPLSGDHAILRDQATQAEDYHVQIAEAVSQAGAWLDFKEAEEMGRIDRDMTVDRQKIELKKRMIPHRLLRDKLEAIAVSMKSRMRRAQWNA